MVLDSSALIAILLNEDGWEELVDVLGGASDPVISAATLLESTIVLGARRGESGVLKLDQVLAAPPVRTVAVDAPQAAVARDAWLRYGKGRHPAGLNYGDCFSYALATTTGRPLLFKGDDFTQTDVASALDPSARRHG